MTNRFDMYRTANLAIVLGLMTLAPSLASAQARCESINGTYAFAVSLTSFIPGPPAILAPWNGIGIMTFDGTGKLSGTQTTNFGGFGVMRNAPFSGTYTVNPDCTGTMTLKSANYPANHLNFVVADSGKTMYAISDDVLPLGSSNSGTLTKIR